jgi:micrococcal nuclease
MLRRLIPMVLIAGALLAGPTAADAAKRGSCMTVGSERCFIWTAKVIAVHDGDTFDARVEGKRRRIRMTGINAMEQSVYKRDPRLRRGDCHSLEATARLEQLIRQAGSKVRLAAQNPRSKSGARLRRAVYGRIRGEWVDLGRTVLSEGHTLWLPAKTEWAWNRDYGTVAERAAAAGELLWDTDYCGAGPAEGIPLSMFLNWDARSNDSANVNGEYVEVSNGGSVDVSLAGWLFRDSAHRQFDFPASAVVPAGGKVTVRVGEGSATRDTFFWGERAPIFENISGDERGLGDGGYLYDPQGDLRAWVMYPCSGTGCGSPDSSPGPEGGAGADRPRPSTR